MHKNVSVVEALRGCPHHTQRRISTERCEQEEGLGQPDSIKQLKCSLFSEEAVPEFEAGEYKKTGDTFKNVTFISRIKLPFLSLLTQRLSGYNIPGPSLLFPPFPGENHGSI